MNIDIIADPLPGLSQLEATQRLQAEGFNELPASVRRGGLQIALEVMREPMFLLLIACGSLYFILGDIEEGLLLLVFVFVVIGITFVQERKTERALEALRDLTSPRALVIRDGQKVRIPGREVVRGDLLILSEGDRVAADALILSCTNLSADESLLTGESVPVRKTAASGQEGPGRPGGDDLPHVFSGTLLVQGQGIGRVERTGVATEIGKIGRALQSIDTENTPLQQQTKKLVKILALTGAVMCIMLVAGLWVTTGSLLEGLLAGLTLGMAMLPEEFPVVLTIFLALGAWRLSQHGVLTRRIPAVETLGAASVLCVDKTGTLTMNQMSVADLLVGDELFEVKPDGTTLPELFHTIVEYSILASPADPFEPMEKAMKELGERTLINTEHLHVGWTLLKEYPLSRDLMAMSRVWRSPDERQVLIAAKGAPEAIADLCHLDREEQVRLAHKVEWLADRGRRVLAVARVRFPGADLPPIQHDFPFEFLGLLGLADPIRPSAPLALAECARAGIRVIMITGDYPGTARNIAREIGLMNPEACLTGPELEKMGEDELARQAAQVNIFARVVPEQKLRLVEALKSNGEVVAMTGDGVNDAPALRAAHIGIAMGGRGSDVAREAASLILIDDDFGSIVQAVRMGRRIFDNLKTAMMFIFAVHIPIAGLSLIPVLLKWPLALFPVHIVFLELIIDPACTVVFEADRDNPATMQRPPRRLNTPLFDLRSLVPSLLQGLIIMCLTLAVYYWNLQTGGEAAARTAGYTTMILSSLGLILTNRGWPLSLFTMLRFPNRPLWIIIGGAILFLALVLTIPFLNNLFRFTRIGFTELALCAAAALLSIAASELLKLGWFGRNGLAKDRP